MRSIPAAVLLICVIAAFATGRPRIAIQVVKSEISQKPAQAPVSISEDSKPAVETLRMIARRIGECPKATILEHRWGKKADEIERYYEEPPDNVIWDVVAGSSVRSPYLGYVEFTVDVDHWVPDTAGPRFMKSSATVLFQEMIKAYPRHYRYEYDLGPSGLQLTRVLLRNKNTGEWAEPKRSVIAEYCWDSVGRDTQPKANAAPDKP